MRIGVVSDTHNMLRNCERIVEIFNAAGVERVVHTGDITQAKTLRVFAGLEAPLVGVYGNNDLERPALEAAAVEYEHTLVDPPLRLTWHGRRIVVVHDPLDLDDATLEGSEVALHGHNHQQVIEREGGRLVLNPGECAGHMPGWNAVGLLDLASLQVEIERF